MCVWVISICHLKTKNWRKSVKTVTRSLAKGFFYWAISIALTTFYLCVSLEQDCLVSRCSAFFLFCLYNQLPFLSREVTLVLDILLYPGRTLATLTLNSNCLLRVKSTHDKNNKNKMEAFVIQSFVLLLSWNGETFEFSNKLLWKLPLNKTLEKIQFDCVSGWTKCITM